MQIFLKWKSWQVFLLLVLLPFGFQSLLMESLLSTSGTIHRAMFTVMPLIMLVFMALYLLWFWSLGTEINKCVPEENRPNPSRFKFGLKFSAVYMLLFQVFFIFSANVGDFDFGLAMPILLILHMAAMYFMFYAIYFISKNLVTYENISNGTAKSSIGTFFLMWFFPIGIWFVQPRINKMYAAKNT